MHSGTKNAEHNLWTGHRLQYWQIHFSPWKSMTSPAGRPSVWFRITMQFDASKLQRKMRACKIFNFFEFSKFYRSIRLGKEQKAAPWMDSNRDRIPKLGHQLTSHQLIRVHQALNTVCKKCFLKFPKFLQPAPQPWPPPMSCAHCPHSTSEEKNFWISTIYVDILQ